MFPETDFAGTMMPGLPRPLRAKGPQPVIDSLVPPDNTETASHIRMPPYRPSRKGLREPTMPRSATFMFPKEDGEVEQEGAAFSSSADRPALLRAQTDVGPARETARSDMDDSDLNSSDMEWGIRHGFDTQLGSEEYNILLTSNFFLYYTDKKHETGGIPKEPGSVREVQEWRMKDRLKTVSAVLALCLNIGVDPPDVVKTHPSAKEECWVDPATVQNSTNGNAPLTTVGRNLQQQYEQLSLRTRYRLALDPTVDETKKYATSLRKSARSERVLFHYNGHGVPRPTNSGEIWVFNRNYTQYIPISLYDLQTWTSGPTLFVWDCSDAGVIIQNFLKFSEKHQADNDEALQRNSSAVTVDCADCIHLAACSEGETLPTNPKLPADLFTACMTTPIKMAVRFHILQDPLQCNVTLQDAMNIPGTISERKTPLGELNWIFTAITDTIAWDVLSKTQFKKLFRQDLMVAALYRNFLLSQRIMRKYNCHPQCHPEIPDTHSHPLWQSWDLAVETMLFQLPDLLAAQRTEKTYEYKHSSFFSEQLTAFEMYLAQDAGEHKVPEQLPIVLQVLLSQSHRLRALILLSQFLDLGPWAVNLALSIGIFPYVLKLLQSQATELKPVMVYIWARILAVDRSCQPDLVKENGYQYFIQILTSSGVGTGVVNPSEHRAMCAFIISVFCRDFHRGQSVCLSEELIKSLLGYFDDMHNPILRQWACLCLSMLFRDYADAKWAGIRCSAHQKLCELALDCVAEVRAAMLHALTSFLGIPGMTPQVVHIEESVAAMVLMMSSDGNSMVRREILVFFSHFVVRYQSRFMVAAYEQLLQESKGSSKPDNLSGEPSASSSSKLSTNTIFSSIWKEILVLSVDPYPEIAEMACTLAEHVLANLLASPLSEHAMPLIDRLLRRKTINSVRSSIVDPLNRRTGNPSTPPAPPKADGYITASIKRTASVAASLKNLAWGSSINMADVTNGLSPTDKAAHMWPKHVTDVHRSSAQSGSSHSKIPMPAGFVPAVEDGRASVPFDSKFFDWCVEYFREPQMQTSEAEEPGSVDYNHRLWRRNRNDKIIAKTQPLKEMAGNSPWDKSKGFWNNTTQPMKLCWHQFDDHLVVSDDKDGISVWDWRRRFRLNRFSNGNPARSKINDVRLINEDDQALLMTGSSDGVIKIFRNYESNKKVQLVSAFRALSELEDNPKGRGLVFDWQQSTGYVVVAGDVRKIRVWNAGTEICQSDLNARSGSPITSLTSDQVEGNLVVAGFNDGALRLYDIRQKSQSALVRVWKEHKAPIVSVHLQRGGQRELASACRSGEVKLWDLRYDKSVKSIQTISSPKDELRKLSVHEHAPVFAVGADGRQVKLFNMNGVMLSHFDLYSAWLTGVASGGVSTLAFHPHRMMVASAALGDSHVSVFACGRKGDKEI